ncbi:putative aromatic hydrocarbon degradation membrane protein [Magnetofaba australis IT-1]|uniref:Putative aromatic hydrocarbon degradation membrane protein n=1 Tax=Magnetofaba australis IT-1 TaxID=1434232 RepID=A0A1Y2K033_9PROT|nr:putative aromatic hydrocarbon degradation membrane protein [Magnetofaba australis IT-1]
MGRAMAPIVYQVNPNLSIGATLDLVWMGLDLQMDVDGSTFAKMMAGNGGTVAMSSNLATTIGGLTAGSYAAFGATDINYGRFDFTDGSDFTGEADGVGAGFKVGMSYKVNPKLTIGAAYHSKTAMQDLETTKASVSFAAVPATMGGAVVPMTLSGKMEVQDFEWPQKLVVGAAYQATDKLLLVGDLSVTDWSNTMKNFKMKFTADDSTSNNYSTSMGIATADFRGETMEVSMTQEWDDQTVLHLGAEYKINDAWSVRGGASFSDNPIPDTYVNALFPATIQHHYTAGVGYKFNDLHNISFAAAYAPKSKATQPSGMEISHSQFNWSLSYSYLFK